MDSKPGGPFVVATPFIKMSQVATPPPLHGPTAKERKYDRQLRLWAASGQQALEEAHVLLLNNGSGAVGIETLKNIVLPGVGTFTIVDEPNVETEDLGVNFFLEESSLQRPRAAECCKFLMELNPEVKGHWVQKVRTPAAPTKHVSKVHRTPWNFLPA